MQSKKCKQLFKEVPHGSCECSSYGKVIGELKQLIVELKKEIELMKNGPTAASSTFNYDTMNSVVLEVNDRNRRCKDVIVFGAPEKLEGESVTHDSDFAKRLVNTVLPNASSNLDFRFTRLGRNATNKPRTLKLTLSSEEQVFEFLKSFDLLKSSGNDFIRSLSSSRDRTLMERNYLQTLRSELQIRMDAGEQNLTIKYIKGIPKIISKNKVPWEVSLLSIVMPCLTLIFYYQNVRGIRTKLTELSLATSVSNCDVIVFTETWLTSAILT
ncbi:hypothetical protein J437_LFUL019330 [Ladona fulva]|uniref:Uncharacterized protein n=1 Tax=Ladona fulva TaxID=123851 RepID=A0A8K0KS53_LADFU|nr:hypothetical protein J437_LFUL019330 [Ladona fulva]